MRRLSSVVAGSKRRLCRALGLARLLKEQLEVAIQYRVAAPPSSTGAGLQRQPNSSGVGAGAGMQRLADDLLQTGHVKLATLDSRYAIFAPGGGGRYYGIG